MAPRREEHKGEDGSAGTETITREHVRTKLPPRFRVILLNDDYTTMDFVIAVLETIFRKSPAEATQIMIHVHRRGQGVAGIYGKEIAEAKASEVHERAKGAGFPLRCILEHE